MINIQPNKPVNDPHFDKHLQITTN